MKSHKFRPSLFPTAAPTAAAAVTNVEQRFAAWLQAVDEYLISMIGLDSAAMEDWLWADAYENGSSAEEAAEEFLAEIFTPF